MLIACLTFWFSFFTFWYFALGDGLFIIFLISFFFLFLVSFRVCQGRGERGGNRERKKEGYRKKKNTFSGLVHHYAFWGEGRVLPYLRSDKKYVDI